MRYLVGLLEIFIICYSYEPVVAGIRGPADCDWTLSQIKSLDPLGGDANKHYLLAGLDSTFELRRKYDG